jgi:putative membrane protein
MMHDLQRGWHIGWEWIIGLIILVLVVLLLVKMFRKDSSESSPDALELLKKRYARGEISKKEYENVKDDLEK